MAYRVPREMTVEEFDAWSDAMDREGAVLKAADEEGGPRLSLVAQPDRNIAWPTDLLPSADDRARQAETGEPAVEPLPFDELPLEDSRNRLAGWSVERQREFLSHLADTGSVHLASAAARLTARSAYRLRNRSPAFAAAWDMAEQLAVGRLSALAFDRAIHGRTEQVWHEGNLVAEKKVPSDKLLMWLLARLDPKRFAAPWEQRKDGGADPQAAAREAFPAALDTLHDVVS